jgi:hypothetical protein
LAAYAVGARYRFFSMQNKTIMFWLRQKPQIQVRLLHAYGIELAGGDES